MSLSLEVSVFSRPYFVIFLPGPEGFVSLQGLLVQTSKWFGISSVQFSSLVTSLAGKFVQFSSVQARWPRVSVQFSSLSSFHELFRGDAEAEPEPAHFGWSWRLWSTLFRAGAGAI